MSQMHSIEKIWADNEAMQNYMGSQQPHSAKNPAAQVNLA